MNPAAGQNKYLAPFKAFLAAGIIVGGWLTFAALYSKPASAVGIELEPITHAKYDPKAIDANIAFHQARVKRDPKGAIGWAILAESWLERSRESDADYAAWEAEAAARKSLALRSRGNGRAMLALVNSLLEQHRFQDALGLLKQENVKTRLTADVLIEIGQYDEAKKILESQNPDEDPSVYTSLARLNSLQGNHQNARLLLQQAKDILEQYAGVPDTAIAWVNVKLGDELRASGDTKGAETLYLEALSLHPQNYKATLALSRLFAAKKDWLQSIRFAKATLPIANSLDAKALLGDAYRALGDEKSAREWYGKCLSSFRSEVADFDLKGKGGPLKVRPIDRQFAQFAAEHRMFVSEALVAAKRDFANRPDPHSHKILANLVQLNRVTLK